MAVMDGLLRSAATMVVVHSLVIVVMSAKNAPNGTSVVVLNSLLIVVMSAKKKTSNVSSVVVLNSLLILVLSAANARNVNSPTTTTCMVQSATNASNVNSQTGRCSQVWHTFTCPKSQKKISKKAKGVFAQSKDFSKP